MGLSEKEVYFRGPSRLSPHTAYIDLDEEGHEVSNFDLGRWAVTGSYLKPLYLHKLSFSPCSPFAIHFPSRPSEGSCIYSGFTTHLTLHTRVCHFTKQPAPSRKLTHPFALPQVGCPTIFNVPLPQKPAFWDGAGSSGELSGLGMAVQFDTVIILEESGVWLSG